MALAVTFVTNIGFGENGRRKKVVCDLAYTSEPYSSGMALPIGKLGYLQSLEALEFVSAGPGNTNQYKYDSSTGKVRIYAETAGTYAEVSGNQTVTIRVETLGW